MRSRILEYCGVSKATQINVVEMQCSLNPTDWKVLSSHSWCCLRKISQNLWSINTVVIYISSDVFVAASKEWAAMYIFTDLPKPLLSCREDRMFLRNVSKFVPDQRYHNPHIHTYYDLCTHALRQYDSLFLLKKCMLGSAKGCRTSDRRRYKKHCHVWIVCWKMTKLKYIIFFHEYRLKICYTI
jgi:hypothetical protein